jgi:hypothetical protein
MNATQSTSGINLAVCCLSISVAASLAGPTDFLTG